MHIITKQLRTFSAAHRLVKQYQGKCCHLHGHNYILEVSFSANELDQFDFVIDFDDIKKHFDRWVQDNWDHVTLISELDPSLLEFVTKEKQRHFVLPNGKNTTAECLAEFLFHQFTKILMNLNLPRLTLESVRVYESETASAAFTRI